MCIRLLVVLMLCVSISQHAIAADAAIEQLPDKSKQEVSAAKPAEKSRGRWLPIPIFVTEPAFGYGLGVALGYFHPEKEKSETEAMPSLQTLDSLGSGRSGQKPPPTITGVAAGYTNNGTWAAGAAHSASWRNDTIRYAGGLAYVNVNSEFYVLDNPFDFNLEGAAFYQDLKYRLGNSRFFLGGKLLLLQTESVFDRSIPDTSIDLNEESSNNNGIAAALTFDGRDNVFTPNRGRLMQVDVWRYDEAIGGDFNYWKGRIKLLSFHQLNPKLVLGLRLDASAVDGRAPFYAYPWVSMRGIPALRYQGKSTGVIEAEARWNFLPRWAVLVFGGAGEVGGDNPAFATEDNIVAGGAGIRYYLMQDLGLWLGVDVARGPEEGYGYITVGQAWK
jgi:hypothetical protein